MAPRDYYEVLGVPETASPDDIKKAFRRLARKHHPDVNRGDSKAESRFKELNEANEVLSDPEKRARYDQLRRLGPGGFDFGNAPQGTGGFGGSGGFGAPGGGTYRGTPIDLEELLRSGGGGGGFGSLFEQLFGGRGGANGAPEPGEDIEVTLDVPAAVAEKGGFARFPVTRNGACPECQGTGAAGGAKPVTCPVCKGEGHSVQNLGNFSVRRTCPRCFGRGVIIERPCAACHGDGTRLAEHRLRVRIPARAKTGDRLRLRGQGHAGGPGQPVGDLFVTLRILAAASKS